MASEAQIKSAIAYCKQQVGKPYVWGATGPDGYDCSGLIYAGFKYISVNIPRTTFAMLGSNKFNPVPGGQPNLQMGDFVFPDSGHVCLYLGSGQIIEAAHTGTNVRIRDIYTPAGTKYLRLKDTPAISGGDGSPIPGGTGAQPGDPIGGAIDAVKSVASFLAFISDPKNWYRVAIFLAGTALLVLGLIMILKSSSAGSTITKSVKKVAKVAIVK